MFLVVMSVSIGHSPESKEWNKGIVKEWKSRWCF